MTCDDFRQPAGNDFLPRQFAQGEYEKGFAGREENGGGDVARPMRAEINPRPGDGRRQKEIEPAPAPEKQKADRADDHVIRHVARGKRGSRFVAVGFVRISNRWFLEQGEELRTRSFQLHHAHSLHLFGPATIDRGLEGAHQKIIRDHEGEREADHERARLESAEDLDTEREDDEERLPNLDVADRGHEQVEPGMRPLFVDEMKNCLIHFPGPNS